MFFSDYGQYSRIEKASLDGQDRVVIVYKGLLRVISLTVDTDTDKSYIGQISTDRHWRAVITMGPTGGSSDV